MTDVKQGTQTVAQGPKDVATQAETAKRVRANRDASGTARRSRRARGCCRTSSVPTAPVYPKGTAIPQRADFNTLDNPFAWSAAPDRDKMKSTPSAGLHFAVFNPSSDDFARNRLAMDGELPDGTKLDIAPRSRAQGFNSVLTTTHRQNFLVPPRRHRSFPLAEL